MNEVTQKKSSRSSRSSFWSSDSSSRSSMSSDSRSASPKKGKETLINIKNITPQFPSEKKDYLNKIYDRYHSDEYKISSETPDVIVYAIDKNTEIYEIQKNKENNDIYLVDYSDVISEREKSLTYAAYHLKTHEKMNAEISKIRYNHDSADFTHEAKILKKMGYPQIHCKLQNTIVSSIGSKENKTIERDILFKKHYPGINLIEFLYKIDKSYNKEDERHFPCKKSLPIFDKLTMLDKLKIIKLILEKFSEIHAKGFLHGNINSKDMKINYINPHNFTLHISDFSAAIAIERKSSLVMGTPGYIAPEVAQTNNAQPYSLTAELFSIGVLIAEILTQHSFQGALRKIIQGTSGMISIPSSKIYQSMPDVFSEKDSENFHRDMNRDKLDKCIFNKLCLLAISLAHKNPQERLKNSSLQKEIANLNGIIQYAEEWEKLNETKERDVGVCKSFCVTSHRGLHGDSITEFNHKTIHG